MKNLSIWLILFLSLNVISCTENSGRNQNNDRNKNVDGTKKITVRYEGSHPIIQDTIKTDKKPQRIKEIYSQYVQGFYFLIFSLISDLGNNLFQDVGEGRAWGRHRRSWPGKFLLHRIRVGE